MEYRLPNLDKQTKRLEDPYVVIIGAGASKAACPNGDKNGKTVPLLRDIHKCEGIKDILNKFRINEYDVEDFEAFYSDIVVDKKNNLMISELEEEIHKYFSTLELPDEITIYDYLVLSLTSKDLIISFNWDPFLMQAYSRNLHVGNLPEIAFLHGNVAVGICYNCKVKSNYGYHCPNCDKPFERMPLLFPVNKKNYSDEPVIKNEWTVAKNYLSSAMGLMIFGYSAPATDIAAVGLLKEALTISNSARIAPFSIVNLSEQEEEQIKKWQDFGHEKMTSFFDDFKKTNLFNNPRVYLETLFDAILQQQPRPSKNESLLDIKSLKELQEFVKNIEGFEMSI